MTQEIDITPKTHILTSMARQDMAPSLAIVELIDNSLDAEGDDNRVDYDVSSHVITISDNGVGAPDPSAIVTMGEHDSEGRDTSGRYGIGAKDAIMALGTAVEIVTIRNGLRRTVRADFEEILSTGRWVAREDQDEVPTGTHRDRRQDLQRQPEDLPAIHCREAVCDVCPCPSPRQEDCGQWHRCRCAVGSRSSRSPGRWRAVWYEAVPLVGRD